ncbi:unnamed protein product [Closterium sp. NIES-64]|nr:unnamed protein product [Closterium sp. NIES-64]
MDVARYVYDACGCFPIFCGPFAVRYAAHQINLHPRVSRRRPPQPCYGGEGWRCGRCSGSGDLGRLSATCLRDKLSLVLLLASSCGSPPDCAWVALLPPHLRRVLSSQDVMFDESVPYYRLFPYRTPSLPPQPLFLVQVEPVEVTGDSGAAEGAEPGGADSGGADPGGAATGGAEPGGAEPGGAEPGVLSLGVLSWGLGLLSLGVLKPGGTELGGAPPGGSPGASSLREPISPWELREWFARRWRRAACAGGSSATEGAAVAGPGGARTGSTGAAWACGFDWSCAAECVGAATTAVVLLAGTLGYAGGSGAAGGAAAAGAPAGGTGLTDRREPASRPASPVRAARVSGRGSRQASSPVPGTHRMSLRPSTAPLRAPLPSPPESSLPAFADPESDFFVLLVLLSRVS